MNSISNPLTRANICEAASFVGVRIIPASINRNPKKSKKNNFIKIRIAEECLEMLKESISEI